MNTAKGVRLCSNELSVKTNVAEMRAYRRIRITVCPPTSYSLRPTLKATDNIIVNSPDVRIKSLAVQPVSLRSDKLACLS